MNLKFTEVERKSFDEIVKQVSVPKSGIVVNFAGSRVGTWKSASGVFLLQAEDSSFRKVASRLQEEGVYVDVPVRTLPKKKGVVKVFAHGIEHRPLNQAATGVIDMALKLEGYFLITLSTIIET